MKSKDEEYKVAVSFLNLFNGVHIIFYCPEFGIGFTIISKNT